MEIHPTEEGQEIGIRRSLLQRRGIETKTGEEGILFQDYRP